MYQSVQTAPVSGGLVVSSDTICRQNIASLAYRVISLALLLNIRLEIGDAVASWRTIRTLPPPSPRESTPPSRRELRPHGAQSIG